MGIDYIPSSLHSASSSLLLLRVVIVVDGGGRGFSSSPPDSPSDEGVGVSELILFGTLLAYWSSFGTL